MVSKWCRISSTHSMSQIAQIPQLFSDNGKRREPFLWKTSFSGATKKGKRMGATEQLRSYVAHLPSCKARMSGSCRKIFSRTNSVWPSLAPSRARPDSSPVAGFGTSSASPLVIWRLSFGFKRNRGSKSQSKPPIEG